MNLIQRLIIIFFSLLPHFHAHAAHYQENYLKAHELFKVGKYEDAYRLYESIPNKSPQVHYNLGVCSYKLNKKGQALAHWRRAEKNWGLFNRTELLQNIALVKNNYVQEDKQEATPLTTCKKYAHDITHYTISTVRAIPIFLLQLFFLLIWAFSFLYLKYLYKRRQKFFIFLIFLANLIAGTMLAIRYNFDIRQHGIIVTPQEEVFSGPGKNYQQLTTLAETTQVLIKGESEGYYKIKTKGIIGWIDKKALELY